MNNLIYRIKAYYHKNRRFIIAGLGFLLLLQICGRGGNVTPKKESGDESGTPVKIHFDTLANGDESLEQVFYESLTKPDDEPPPKYNPLFMEMLLMTSLILIFYLAQKRGWIGKLMPAWVFVSIKKSKSRAGGETLLHLEINNKTKDSITFEPPVLTFKRYSKTKRFKIKGSEGQSLFPLTLMPDTGHKLVINIDRFKKSMPELKKYKNISISIEADNGKTYNAKPNVFTNWL
jgi:hypothetical protein